MSFGDKNGGWQEPENLKELNTSEFDFDPVVTLDGKYLFFISRKDFSSTIPNRNY